MSSSCSDGLRKTKTITQENFRLKAKASLENISFVKSHEFSGPEYKNESETIQSAAITQKITLRIKTNRKNV